MGILSRNTNITAGKKVTKEITVINRLGLHARPAAMFVKVCNRHKSEIWVEKDGEQVNGKSIMGLMMLAAGQGSKLRITCEGGDAEKAIDEIESLVLGRFDHPEAEEQGRIDACLRREAERIGVPCVSGAPIGHFAEQIMVPQGMQAELDAGAGWLRVC